MYEDTSCNGFFLYQFKETWVIAARMTALHSETCMRLCTD